MVGILSELVSLVLFEDLEGALASMAVRSGVKNSNVSKQPSPVGQDPASNNVRADIRP